MKKLITYLLSKIPHRDIVDCNRNVYLTRWYIFRRERLACLLHLFHRSDEDRALHDHPWSFITIILWRGYNEITNESVFLLHPPYGETVQEVRKRKWPGMICWRPAEWRHRVELIDGKPSVTLVFRFKKRREWGFWETTGWVPWNKWWKDKCE